MKYVKEDRTIWSRGVSLDQEKRRYQRWACGGSVRELGTCLMLMLMLMPDITNVGNEMPCHFMPDI